MPSIPFQTLGQRATLACLWEATAAKPGNVYRAADFRDMSYADFLASATAIAPAFDRASDPAIGVGQLVLDAVQATQAAVDVNTNLGTVLLLAPLAKAAGSKSFRVATKQVAESTTLDDARHAYEAIRLAAPGGLGEATEQDVSQPPDVTLIEAMRLSEDRDLVARQYSHGFEDVFRAADAIVGHLAGGRSLADAVVLAYLELMSRRPDTLILRKCGPAVAQESADRASMALEALATDAMDLRIASAEFDFWLRADGRRRNPGATADAIAAALFALLCEERLEWPVRFYD